MVTSHENNSGSIWVSAKLIEMRLSAGSVIRPELLTRNRIILSASAISSYRKSRDAVCPRLPSFVEVCVGEGFVS